MPIRFEYAPVEPLDSDFRRNDGVVQSTRRGMDGGS